MFEEFMQEFFIRRREINVYELLKLFPDFDKATAQMYLRKLDMLLPDVVDEFGGDKIFSAVINSDAVLKDKAIVKEVQSGIKTVFKKDALDIQLAMAIELVVEESEKQWKAFRNGVLGFGISSIIRTVEDGKWFLKPTAAIKKLRLINSEDDEDMETESSAIYGLVNLMLKKSLKNYTVSVPAETFAQILPCFNLNPQKLDVKLVPGFLDITLFEKNEDTLCP